MTREHRTGQARPAVSCGPHFSPRKDFLTLPFPGRAGKSFPVRRSCLMHRHPGCSGGQHRTRAFPCTVRENGGSPPEGHACSSQRHESLAAAPAWHQNREELLPLLSIQPGPFRRAPARPGGLCASPDRHGPGHGSGIFPCPPPRAHGRLPRWGPSRHGRRPRRSDRDRWPRPL